MKLLSWNCQGIGNPKTVRALNKLITTYCPDIIFLMETKLLSSKATFLSRYTNTYNVHQVDCSTVGRGRAGGFLLLWNSCNIDLTIINENFNYIDMQISHNNIHWRATGLYGYSQNHQKHLTCSLIDQLAQDTTNPKWLLFGDFNIIMYNHEKQGGNSMDSNIINLFRNTTNRYSMQDLGYSGEIFTWNNRQDDNNHIKERLDRFLASEDWLQTFPSYLNSHLVRYKSDHCPMLLDFSTNPVCRNQKMQQKSKKYELMWSSH
jgi:exonuclease III